MRLIQSKVELINQGSSIEDIYRHIELCGRVCYKSEDKITPDSAKEFVDRMIKSGHGAMLEHGTVYLMMPLQSEEFRKYIMNPYSKVVAVTLDNGDSNAYITSNYRVLVEHNWLDDLQYMCEPTEFHEKRITVKWTCDRVTGESFLRHRVFSFARESTRFCNYSKDKFDNQITYIIPSWCNDLQDGLVLKDNLDVDTLVWGDVNTEDINNIKVDEYTRTFLYSCIDSELNYIHLINKGYKPQQARQVLPFCIKPPPIMTGFRSDWDHFFELRCAKSAHPDAQKLANELKDIIDGSEEVR